MEGQTTEQEIESTFFATHCQPYYGEEIARFMDEWERERYREGFEDADEEYASRLMEAESEVKPLALQRWLTAYEGGPRRAATDAHLPQHLRQQICTRFEEDLDRWAVSSGIITLLDDLPYEDRQSAILKYTKDRLFTGRVIANISDLELACGVFGLSALYTDVSAWCAQARDVHVRVSVAFEASRRATLPVASTVPEGSASVPDPPVNVSISELYASIASLIAVDARMASGDGDAVSADIAALIKWRLAYAQGVLQLAADISQLDAMLRGGSADFRECALCNVRTGNRSTRLFAAMGLRAHALAVHGVR